MDGQAIPMSQQLDHWRSIHQELTRKLGSSKAQIHISKSLFVLIIGSNDVLDYYGSLEKLHETGTPRLLIFWGAQLGCTPEKREELDDP
ncbi:hypothetical protein Bca52824_022175 [Brassica carinata]|uniref:Uncharacterized protein n=1 Tax=Brassica carinata TaxID=52824 RepID=A0A8X7VG77_BRACI|nr:hypothetical protein Bca52824_022175 [Brassica carinata]